MRIAQLRIIAWGLALLCAAWLLLRGTDRPNPVARAGSGPDATPGLFHLDGATEIVPLIPIDEAQPVQRASVRALVERDPGQSTGNVIHEPDASRSAAPYDSAYKLGRDEGRPAAPLPLELMLNAPQREAASLQPRVADEMRSEPHLESPPVRPRPRIVHSTSDPAMRPVNALAQQHVLRGFSLGDKAAIYAARIEFIQALRTIAQALDAQAQLTPKDPQSSSQALARGLRALAEADDFVPSGSQLDGDLDLAAIIAAHRTPAAKKSQPTSQLASLQIYFDFAREELQRAAADSPVASQALAGLGKTYTVATERAPHRLSPAKAMVFHQAAVRVDPSNHLAANELGVLLGKHGQWEPAKQALLQSLRVQPDAATWRNLATAHQQLGEHELAQLAEQERQLLVQKQPDGAPNPIDGKPTVQWVDPRVFAGPPEEARPAEGLGVPATAANSKPANPAGAVQKAESRSWWPWR